MQVIKIKEKLKVKAEKNKYMNAKMNKYKMYKTTK